MRKASHPVLWDKILFLSSTKRLPGVKGEAFEVEHVREGANISWKDLTIDTSILDLGYPDSSASPRRPHL